jgi:hypothetical protein
MLLHLVADYGAGDLAFAEVQQRFALELPEAVTVPTPVRPFDTLAAGFCVAQLALTEGPCDRVVFHNVAPRQDTHDPRTENEGERLVVADVPGGVRVMGVNAGLCFSFLREHATLRYVDAPISGSQFRSRDFFPAALAALVREGGHASGAPVPADHVPAVPEGVIAYVDGYGNLKTTWTGPPAPSGERVLVRIGGVAAPAIVSDGTFSVGEGELSFAPGSSGWPLAGGGEVRFFELFLRGASAAARFSHPTVGSQVEIGPLS